MTKEKNKHDHKLTNLLKVGIFSLLMIAPLFASISQWMYATINKNAYQSYGDVKLVEQMEQVINENSIYENYSYTAIQNTTNTGYSMFYGIKSTTLDLQTLFPNKEINYLGTYYENGSNYIVGITNDYSDRVFYNNSDIDTFSFISNGQYINIGQNGSSFNYYFYLYSADKLDNAFYYGVDQMTKSDLFNWTENTTIYTGIKEMTDNLEIQTNAIAILLTYWTILTIVYVIFDILIQGFTFITHKIVE